MDNTYDVTPEQKLRKLRCVKARAAVSQLHADAQARGTDGMTMAEISAELS